MDPPLNDSVYLPSMETFQMRLERAREIGKAFFSSKLPKLEKPNNFVDNNVDINYVKLPEENDTDSNESLPSEVDSKRSASSYLQSVRNNDLSPAVKEINMLPVSRKNLFSLKFSDPDIFQSKADAYNNQVKSSVSKPLGGKQIYFRFRVQENLHKVEHSKDAVVYQCHICKGPYKQKFSLKRHFLRNHVHPDYISTADKSNCKITPQNEEMKQQFEEESKTPSGRKRFKNNGAIFFIPDGKTRVPGLYKCHQCDDIRFDIEEDLKKHYSSHLNLNKDDIFPCNLCSAVFQRKQALSKHMISHTEKKVIFHCKKCPLQFEKITDFTCHLQSHGSGKRCKYCDKEFSTPANRKRHENIHERGRVFSCKLCKVKFSRSKELEKHVKKMHSNLKVTCPHCPAQANPVVYISQYFLETHITLKHRDITKKKIVSSKTTGMYKSHSQKLCKESFCCFCKKKFSSVKAMVNHKNVVHKNEIAKHKPKKFSHKELPKEKSGVSEHSQKIKNLPNSGKCPNEKVVSKVDDHSNKTGILGKKRTTYERKAKSSSHYKLARYRPYRSNDKAYAKFYANVHSNIADNYINHVDGGLSQLNLKNSNFQDQNEPIDYRSNTSEIPWSAQNFSNYYDLDGAMNKREENSLLFPQEQCLYATGLERNESTVEKSIDLSSSNSAVDKETTPSFSQEKPSMLEMKEKLLSHEVCVTYVCDVCKGTFSNYSTFEDHSINNHPNVEVSFVEIEGIGNNPPKVPGELKTPYFQPNGMLVSCDVLQEQNNIACTKCRAKFITKDELYSHIFQCVTETSEINVDTNLEQKNSNDLPAENVIESHLKPNNSSGWFSWNKQLFKSSFRRNKFENSEDSSNIKDNKRGRRKLPPTSKLGAVPCPFCESVFVSAAKLSEHIEICTYRFKNQTSEDKFKKKYRSKKQRNNQSSELPQSLISLSENGSSSNSVKHPGIVHKELEVISFDADLDISSSDSSAVPPADNSNLNKTNSNLNSEETFAVEQDPPILLQNPEVQTLRNVVRKVCENVSKSSVIDFIKNYADESLVDISSENMSTKSMKSTKNEDIIKPITVTAKEKLVKISEVSLPKIKEVVKEMKLAASSSPNSKKSNAPLTFISHEANRNIGFSPNNSSSLSFFQSGLKTHSTKEVGSVNDSPQVSKARQRKKRKPVKIMHKRITEAENRLEINVNMLCSKQGVSDITPHTLENNSFKPIENSESKLTTSTDPEIPSLPDLVPEKEKIDFHNSDEKFNANVLKSIADSSKNILTDTSDQILSSVFLSESNGDRDSPSLELLVSSVTQNIENFDKPSLLDDDKFALQAPDLINAASLKSTDKEFATDNGLNFRIIIPAVDSPSKSQVSDGDSMIPFTPGMSTEKPKNETLSSGSSNKNNGLGDNGLCPAMNKIKSLLNATENVTNIKEPINNKIENSVSVCAENSPSIIDQTEAVTPLPQNGSISNSTAMNLFTSLPLKSQQNCCSEEDPKESSKKNEELLKKSTIKEKTFDNNESEDRGKNSKDKRSVDNLGFKDKEAFKPDRKKGFDDKKRSSNSSNGVDDSSDSKKSTSEQFTIAAKVDPVNLLSGQKSIQLKDKVKSKLVGVVHNKVAQNESQKRKMGSKLALREKCDFENSKSVSSKSPVNNHQPTITTLETNKQLIDINEDRKNDEIGIHQPKLAMMEENKQLTDNNQDGKNNENGMSSSENSAKLRLLRMKKPTTSESSDKTPNINMRSDNSFETDHSDDQLPKRRKIGDSSGFVPSTVSNDGGCCSKTLDNGHVSESDKNIVVKKETPDSGPLMNRFCPYCYLDFAYLSNFRRHIRTCSSRGANDTNESPAAPPSSQFQHLPKKNEVEHSMLNLKRHQIRQNEFIKETKTAKDSKPKNSFQKFNCPICHKIYLSYFPFIQHQVQAHKMSNNETREVNDGASTSQGVQVMPLEENGSSVRQMATPLNFGASTSQGFQVVPSGETKSENDLPGFGISSESPDGGKDSKNTVESRVKETNLIEEASKKENISSDVPPDELRLDSQEIQFYPSQHAAKCLENGNNSTSSNRAENITSTSPSIQTNPSPDARNSSNPNDDKEHTDLPTVALPSYGKGRGRKKKRVQENLLQKEEDSVVKKQSNTEEAISYNKPRDDISNISKGEPVINNSMLKEVGKTPLSDLKSSPKNTLVNKLRNTLSKSMQCGNNMKIISKFNKTSETLQNDASNDLRQVEKSSPPLKSALKKSSIEMNSTVVETHVHNNAYSANISRRGRKKSALSRVPLKQNNRGFKQETNKSLSEIDVRSKTIDSSGEVIKSTESNPMLPDSSKINQIKSLHNQTLSSPVSPIISVEEKTSIKKTAGNTFQPSKTTRVIKSTKTSPQEVNHAAQPSPKTNGVTGKVKNSRSIKLTYDDEPTPSTSSGITRGRNSKATNIQLDLSSELEDANDFQQKKPVQRKKLSKVCPICKKKFPAMLQRNRHLQLVHGRKRNRNESSISPTSVPTNKDVVNKVTDSPVSVKKDAFKVTDTPVSMKKETVNKIIDSPMSMKKETISKLTNSLISMKKEAVDKVDDTSMAMKKEVVNKVINSAVFTPDRSAYQRQCSKPLPPLKRKYQKAGFKNIQPVKKTKR